MPKTILVALALLGLGAVNTGCVFVAMEHSSQGQAWIAKNTPFGSSFWHCDARTGEPTCTKVTNTPAGAAPASGGGAK